ncbi:MAG: hypothetical protein QOE70_3451 [Chthoniobacter sp.]|jgi:biotin carboxyl carrier protein|nr:hypothetical protein [Chthoniobacter sp.]
MSAHLKDPDPFANALAQLGLLLAFQGPAKRFWELCVPTLAELVGARRAVLLREGPADSPGWKKAVLWAAPGEPDLPGSDLLKAGSNLAETCVQQGGAACHWPAPGEALSGCAWVAVRLISEGRPEAWVAAFVLPGSSPEAVDDALKQLRLLAHLPVLHELRQRVEQSEVAVAHFAAVLDLVALLNAQHRFMAVAMSLCNELASRHQCDRVCLGWLEGNYVRVQAISHSERFEKKMEAIKQLETAMEEALDQDEAVAWPEPEDQRLVTRDHARFAGEQGVKFVCSVPLRLEGKPAAVLTCERNNDRFAEVEVRLLTLCGEMAIRRLGDLRRTDRWFGARWMVAGRERLSKLLGPEHTGAKALGLALVAAALVLVFGRMNYRVDAPFFLRTEDSAFLTAPFNGYLDEVKVDVGDEVKQGDLLASLDTRDLLLEEAGAVADQTRYLRETEKSSAADKPADMRIAQAQAEQARARLEILRYRRGQAKIVSPFTGVVVEGDLKKRIDSPLKQGDVLFKVARIDRLYVECQVHERDVHELRLEAGGEMALASMPKLRFPVRVQRIEPAAQASENANVFIVRCTPEGSRRDWWRPGMSGVVRLDAGERSLLWIVSHRTVDFLRMHLWW